MTVHKLRPKSVCMAELVFGKTRRIALFYSGSIATWFVYPKPGAEPFHFKSLAEAKAKFAELASTALDAM